MPIVETRLKHNTYLTEGKYSVEERQIVRTVKSEEEYIQIYTKLVAVLNDVGNAAVKTGLFLALHEPERKFKVTRLVKKGNREITQTYEFKAIHIVDTYEMIATAIGVQVRTVIRHMKQLKRAGLILELSKGIKILNPEYFWKSSTESRRKTIHIILEWKVNETNQEEDEVVLMEEVEVLPQGDVYLQIPVPTK